MDELIKKYSLQLFHTKVPPSRFLKCRRRIAFCMSWLVRWARRRRPKRLRLSNRLLRLLPGTVVELRLYVLCEIYFLFITMFNIFIYLSNTVLNNLIHFISLSYLVNQIIFVNHKTNPPLPILPHRTPRSSMSTTERLQSMSPAAQRIASEKLKLGYDKYLQASYSPSPRHDSSRVTTPSFKSPRTPGSHTPKMASKRKSEEHTLLTDNLLKLPKPNGPGKCIKASDFF